MTSHEQTHTKVIAPAETAFIWKTFWILLVITAGEFVVAFGLSPKFKLLKILIFVTLTLVKAFYIVAEFMHLKYEVKQLIYIVVLPIVFLAWLILALLIEGGYMGMIN